MKILAFTDVHANMRDLNKVLAKTKQKPELMVSCGDLSNFSDGLDAVCKKLNSAGIPILSIHGNHEGSGDMKKMYKKYENFIDIHAGTMESGDFLFFGYGGGGFSKRDKRFEKIAANVKKSLSKGQKLIFITHMPPYKTTLDAMPHDHVGSKSYRQFIKEVKPILVLSGHIDENAHARDKVGKSRILNPGPDGIILEI